jgi:hypothetical protein
LLEDIGAGDDISLPLGIPEKDLNMIVNWIKETSDITRIFDQRQKEKERIAAEKRVEAEKLNRLDKLMIFSTSKFVDAVYTLRGFDEDDEVDDPKLDTIFGDEDEDNNYKDFHSNPSSLLMTTTDYLLSADVDDGVSTVEDLQNWATEKFVVNLNEHDSFNSYINSASYLGIQMLLDHLIRKLVSPIKKSKPLLLLDVLQFTEKKAEMHSDIFEPFGNKKDLHPPVIEKGKEKVEDDPKDEKEEEKVDSNLRRSKRRKLD